MTQRVALVSPYSLSVYGGVQEQVLAMSRELSARGRDVLIVAPDSSDTASYETPVRVVREGRLLSLPANGSRAPLTLSPGASRRARRAIEDFSPDVIHFHEPFAPLVGWAALRAHRYAALATFHRSGGGPAFNLTAPLLRRLARGIDVATAVSDSAAATIQSAVGIEATVLFNGFETDRFTATPRERADERLLVTVGRLEERKGTAYAIKAVRAHNEDGEDPWRLVVIGEGPQRARLEALAAHDDMIVFCGAVSDGQKRAWLRRADVLIAPALRGESFGLVLLEGMASETMVVASDIAGYREAGGDHAVLFEPGNARSLEVAVRRAITDDGPERLASAKAHAEHWSMSHLMDEYETLYDESRRRFGVPR
jgi:phosphatidylinositol alpha-mannosyltransferase